jgi:hypothetical protein
VLGLTLLSLLLSGLTLGRVTSKNLSNIFWASQSNKLKQPFGD